MYAVGIAARPHRESVGTRGGCEAAGSAPAEGAYRASDEGATRGVRLGLTRLERRAAAELTDNGWGLDTHELDRPFFQS